MAEHSDRNLEISRRALLSSLAGAGAAFAFGVRPSVSQEQNLHSRVIPSSGEAIPAIGMGTWVTFNVNTSDADALRHRAEILATFFERGGAMVDSSPMYGTSEKVVGLCLETMPEAKEKALFSATKVWTMTEFLGTRQMAESEQLWGEERFDLMQVHNLLDWDTHLPVLKDWKKEGRIRYLGITTSHGRRHGDLEELMKSEPLDFVQFTYNILDRQAEARLLPLAADRGIATIINRPFQHNGLFRAFGDRPLPEWAGEIDCANWAQFFLKFVISHPAVTCAIPATSQIPHMQENMGALRGALPDAATRKRMVAYVESL
jgi:diketogulonate reductase-like aldo/keto reductase